MALTHISLCSGIGGIDLAAEYAGFTTIAQCEIDPYASRVLAKNFKGVFNYGDIRAITNDSLVARGIFPGSVTALSAGFPCQPYSLAGKGQGDCDSRDLWGEVKRCIGIIKPKWFIGENTPGLFARANQKYFHKILADLAALGYTVSWGIWGAADVGALHKRDRVFIVSHTYGKREQGERLDQPQELSANTLIRICGVIPDTASHKLGLHRSAEETGEVTSCRTDNGLGTQAHASRERWEAEPDVGRVAYGVSDRVDRLRCLGNAVVPAQVYPVFAAIAEYEMRKN